MDRVAREKSSNDDINVFDVFYRVACRSAVKTLYVFRGGGDTLVKV